MSGNISKWYLSDHSQVIGHSKGSYMSEWMGYKTFKAIEHTVNVITLLWKLSIVLSFIYGQPVVLLKMTFWRERRDVE